MNKYNKLLIIILLTYILIPICIFFVEELYYYKFYILTIVGIVLYLITRCFKIPLKELGITTNNLVRSIKRNSIIIIVFIILVVVAKLLRVGNYIASESMGFYLFYIFLSCPIQEFLYRGVFGYFEKHMKSNIWFILSSLCYSFVHLIYRDYLVLIITFVMGIIWYSLYRKDYNLGGVCLSHIILGILTISLGIIN